MSALTNNRPVLFSALLLLSAAASSMEELGVDELSAVTGQEGIRVGLELRMNTNANAQPITSGTTFANCASTTNFSSTGCRMALKFANREDGGGEWVVFKNFSAYLNAPAIYLDATRTPAAATAYEDLDRFRDENGVPLLASPHDIPNIALTFPEPIELAITIGGINIEYGATGYLNNANAPFMGIKVGNVDGGAAVINAEGTMQWYGF